jgi:hypothetical protein
MAVAGWAPALARKKAVLLGDAHADHAEVEGRAEADAEVVVETGRAAPGRWRRPPADASRRRRRKEMESVEAKSRSPWGRR